MKSNILFVYCLLAGSVFAQKPLIKIDDSPYAIMQNVGLDEVRLTNGFWKERQDVNNKVSQELLWELASNEETGYTLNNFEVAAGLKEGEHMGVNWHDAWLYKWIESACYVYNSTGDESLIQRVDSVIPIIVKAQEEDGYIATQVTTGKVNQHEDLH